MSTTESAEAATEADARLLEAAAAVLTRRFGKLTAGDLIDGLVSCTTLLRSGAGIIQPAQPEEPAREEPPAEGWGVIRPGDRRAHYYRDGFSLCRRVGFYSGQLWPDLSPSPDDHKECRTILNREKAKEVPAGQPQGDEPGHGYHEAGDYP